MRTKFTFLIALLVLSSLLGACVSTSGNSNEMPRTLNVNGNAQIKVAPDVAYISIGVHTDNANAAEAVASNNAQAQRVIDALKAMGVAEADIQTSNFSIYPSQQYDENGMPSGTIYMVDNTVYVSLRDLPKVGNVVQAAVEAGANNIYGIQFDLADKETVVAEARTKAIQNARQQAEEIAAAAGISLGAVQSISYYNSYPTPLYEGKGGGYAMDASVPVSAGQLTISVDVNITYEIK